MSTHIKVRLAVAYHSGYGHTERFARAVAQGAEQAGADVLQVSVEQADLH